MTEKPDPTIVHLVDFDEREAFETESRGVYDHAVIEFSSGRKYSVSFYDPIRLSQDLESASRSGQPCLAEVGLIVLPAVTQVNMEKAVKYLAETGYFDKFVPMSDPDSAG